MLALEVIAERRIREGQERGEFDDLPGACAPLGLDDDALVPEELRVACRMQKNAGFLPPELEAHREIEQMLQAVEEDGERRHLISRINFLLTRAAPDRRRENLPIEAEYFEQVAERFAEWRPG